MFSYIRRDISALGALFFLGAILFWFLGGWQWLTQRQLDDIQVQTAENFEAQYYLMGSESSAVDKCAQANLVAQAWLQAQDQAAYQAWQGKADGHCSAVE